MVMRVYPQEYFGLQEENQYKQGIIMGAILIIIGVMLGGFLVYFASKKTL